MYCEKDPPATMNSIIEIDFLDPFPWKVSKTNKIFLELIIVFYCSVQKQNKVNTILYKIIFNLHI